MPRLSQYDWILLVSTAILSACAPSSDAVSGEATYTVGGSLSGLAAGKVLILENNGGDDLTLITNGKFAFRGRLHSGSAFAVSISSQPEGQLCTATSETGLIDAADVLNVAVSCITAPSLQAIEDDMQYNEMALDSTFIKTTVGWYTHAITSMGNHPNGLAAPTWWEPANNSFKSDIDWLAMAPWFVVAPGVGHSASNVRIKIYDYRIFFLRKSTGTWVEVPIAASNPTWGGNFDFTASTKNLGNASTRIEADGRKSFKLDSSSHPIHGGFGKYELALAGFTAADLAAVCTRVTTQLILDDPLAADDRNSARLTLSIGLDYYPTLTTTVSDFAPMGYVPNATASRFGLVTSAPRFHYGSTIDSMVGTPSSSEYTTSGNRVTVPISAYSSLLPLF